MRHQYFVHFAFFAVGPWIPFSSCTVYRYFCGIFLDDISTREQFAVLVYCYRVKAIFHNLCTARKYDHVTQLLVDLYWLRVPQRIQCKLCVLVHGCLNGAAAGYLSDLTVSVASAVLHVVGSVQRQPLIWWCHQLVAHPSETVRLPWQVHERGTVYR